MASSFGIEFPDGIVDGLIEVLRSGERLVCEVMPLQVAPENLDIVQLRGGFRQPLDAEPGGALGEGGARRLAGVERAVVEDQNEGLERDPELGPIAPIDLLQERDEARAALGSAGVNHELAPGPVEHAEHRHFGALARGRNAQIGPPLGPDVRQVRGVRASDSSANRSTMSPASAWALSSFRRRPARSTTFPSWRPFSVWPARRQRKSPFGAAPRTALSTRCARPRVSRSHPPNAAASSSGDRPQARTSSATARARSALTGAGPGATDVFSASIPPVMKALRQNRTVSSRTPKAWAIWPLVQPDRVSKIARARSASPRSREWLRATSADLCSASALTGDLPAMIPVPNQIKRWNHGPHPLASLTTPA